MKKLFCIIIAAFLFISFLSAQRVGLVLSGGGAKGIIHIGVIKALEEHGIPIDYITGTSMGAIIGGLYATGLTADEMIEILKSDDFKLWSTGEIETDYKYYYYSADPKPSFVDLRFHVSNVNSLEIRPNILPTNLVSPTQMNIAFIQLFAQANAVADENFDNLFVPFRCVASDIYEKKAITFSSGNLGNAIRASMTYPLMFKPIKIDGRLLFDGGIFNNFPVDVMRKDFNPELMIGSVVGANPSKPDEDNVMSQMENMIIYKTNYDIPETDGILLNFDLEGINTFDFTPVDRLVKMGYDSTLVRIEQIKARINRQEDSTLLAAKREQFRKNYPELRFKNITVGGVDSLQQEYIKQIFRNEDEVFGMDEFKQSYFMLVSDDKISEVFPRVSFDKESGAFSLNLRVKVEDQLKLHIGGNVSSSTSNQAYMGISYQNLSKYAFATNLDIQFGKMYNSVGLDARVDIPATIPMYVKFSYVFHRYNFYNTKQWFFEDNQTANFSQIETYGKLKFGLPLKRKGRLEFGLGYGYLIDRYRQSNQQITKDLNDDRSRYSLGSAFTRIETYTLNNVLYPTEGYKYLSSLQLIGGVESFMSGMDSESQLHPETRSNKHKDLWLQYRATGDHYLKFKNNIVLGIYGELAFSTRKLLDNYTATIIQAPSFGPTPHSKANFNSAFSADQFLALGIKPIYRISDQIHFRGEGYFFLPHRPLKSDINGAPYYADPTFKATQFLAETSLVIDLRLISIGAFMNYYSSGINRLNLGVNIGFLLFRERFAE